jgi:uncharacterized membrane protein
MGSGKAIFLPTGLLFIFCMFFACAGVAQAAFIQGNIFDSNLDIAKNSIVRINSTPAQSMVARDGTYQFHVEPGSYLLTATTIDNTGRTEETLLIERDGSFSKDIILFPVLNETLVRDEEFTANSFLQEQNKNLTTLIVLLVVVLMALLLLVSGGFLFFILREKRKLEEHSDELKEYIKELRQERDTLEKEFAREFPPEKKTEVEERRTPLVSKAAFQNVDSLIRVHAHSEPPTEPKIIVEQAIPERKPEARVERITPDQATERIPVQTYSVDRTTARIQSIEQPSATDKELIKQFIRTHSPTTQKDVRQAFPLLSEAKISLIISELEHDGRVRKIKKGRGNIISNKDGRE